MNVRKSATKRVSLVALIILMAATMIYPVGAMESYGASKSTIVKGVQRTTIKAKATGGTKFIKVTWTKSKGYKVNYYQIFRSKNRNSGYGNTVFYKTASGRVFSYKNTRNITPDMRYYYKVRGVRVIGGKKYYTKWSNVVYAKAQGETDNITDNSTKPIEEQIKDAEEMQQQLTSELKAAESEFQKAKTVFDEKKTALNEAKKGAAAFDDGAFGFYQANKSQAALKVFDEPVHKSKTIKGSATDATSLENMKKAIQLMKKCNNLRVKNHNLQPLLITDQAMAIAQYMCNASTDEIKHQDRGSLPGNGECLAWGYSDPFDGWYDKEKALYNSGERDFAKVGHYLSIINGNYKISGMARATRGLYGGVTDAQEFMISTSEKTYTVAEYETRFMTYYNKAVNDKKNATSKIEAAEKEFKDAESKYNSCKSLKEQLEKKKAEVEKKLEELKKQ